jgi:histone H1/5
MRKAKKATKKKAAPKRKVARRKAAPKRKVAKKKAATKRVRCAGKTKAGKKCKRFTNGKAKMCSVHKRK